MAKTEGKQEPIVRWYYIGRRIGGDNKAADVFITDPDDDDTKFFFKAFSHGFAIGKRYDIKNPSKGQYRIGGIIPEISAGFEELPDSLVSEWSALDASTRRAVVDASARSKLIRDQKDTWKQALEKAGLRRIYWGMSPTQQRAMRSLVIEWLEESL